MYDSQGRQADVQTLGHLDAGIHEIVIHRENLSSGIYLFNLEGTGIMLHSGKVVISD